jgi:ComF family protein
MILLRLFHAYGVFMYLQKQLSQKLRFCFNLLYPHRCILCLDQILESDLCPKCWASLTFIREPICFKCGMPLIFKNQEHICEKLFTQSRFILKYDECSKPLFMKFKYFDATSLARVFAKWIIKIIPPHDPFWSHINGLIPVPLHRLRLFSRQYNQSALLCQELQKFLPHLTIYYNVLKRKKRTAPQGKLSGWDRNKNLKDAFIISQNVPENLLLVDDVWASGATLKSCAKTLSKPLKVLCIAKSIR